ncbi:NAD-binding protein [Bradyrhizobium sp. LTSPM299]|uniref:potassium channel family protein n=1 Tax=Bradyrhizobium sp. LTSPM299 TaxID=1619233 RepID=UPI0006791492|nr:NAD-binding protein [Bradyrhizobium sp. LTSPM299]
MTEEGRPTTGSDAVPRGVVPPPDQPRPGSCEPRGPTAAAPVRRVHNPRMAGLFDSPVRNIIAVIAYTLLVMAIATGAYMRVGWSFRDAIYMVVVTVYTVGYNEVRPINTPALNVITIGLIVFGCTGIIFLTGALVQLITQSQINRTIGLKRMNSQIDDLKDHVIVCGFGRLGAVLARSLRASSTGFVLIEEGEARAAEARAQGYLCIHGDASSETVLQAAGVMRAAALATVLSNHAVNVFITLSARALNQNLSIVARRTRLHREQTAAGRRRQGGVADPNRRGAHCRGDPARGIGALHRGAGALAGLSTHAAQFRHRAGNGHRRAAECRGADDGCGAGAPGQGRVLHRPDQPP